MLICPYCSSKYVVKKDKYFVQCLSCKTIWGGGTYEKEIKSEDGVTITTEKEEGLGDKVKDTAEARNLFNKLNKDEIEKEFSSFKEELNL